MQDKFYNSRLQTEYGNDYSNLLIAMKNVLKGVNTSLPVKVIRCDYSGLALVGFVDLEIQVTQLNGAGEVVDNPKLYNVPYFRYQGGKNAVIIDPEPGDIGTAIFQQRDTSGFNRTKKKVPPSSFRMHSLSDAVYIGGIRNDVPVQIIHFEKNQIRIYSPNKVLVEAPNVEVQAKETVINSPTVTVNANSSMTVNTPTMTVSGQLAVNGGMTVQGGSGKAATITGELHATGDITSGGISVQGHTHAGVHGKTSAAQ